MSVSYSALILAGGKSERMNFPKAFLKYRGKTFLNALEETYYAAGVTNIITVINARFCTEEWEKHLLPLSEYSCIIKNYHPEMGRFHSIKLGIEKMEDTRYCFIQNADNPFLTNTIIEQIQLARNNKGYTVPTCRGKGGHPVLISYDIINTINATPNLEIDLRSLLNGFDRKEAPVNDERILWNINTKDDYRKYIQENINQVI